MPRKSPPPGPRDASRLVLEADLGQHHAIPLVEEMRDLQGQPLEIDASQINSMSTLCLQVLLSAGVSWRAGGHELRLVEPSPAFMATLQQTGVDFMAFQSPGSAA